MPYMFAYNFLFSLSFIFFKSLYFIIGFCLVFLIYCLLYAFEAWGMLWLNETLFTSVFSTQCACNSLCTVHWVPRFIHCIGNLCCSKQKPKLKFNNYKQLKFSESNKLWKHLCLLNLKKQLENDWNLLIHHHTKATVLQETKMIASLTVSKKKMAITIPKAKLQREQIFILSIYW